MVVSSAQLGIVLGWAAFALHLLAFAVYNWKMLRGKSTPNITTWSVWAFVASLNCVTYFFMGDDWITSLQPLASSLACLLTFGLCLFRREFKRPTKMEIVILLVSAMAILFWWLYQNATYANLILQLGFVLSFVPTVRTIIRKPSSESALPWLMWGVVYCLLIATVLLRWNGEWSMLAYPIISAISHSLAGLLALRR